MVVIHLAVKTVAYNGSPLTTFKIDEIERILPTSQDSHSKVEEFNVFFQALRVLSQDKYRKLSFLVADINPDCNRINYWLQEGVSTNPVFKFFTEIFLPPFSENETMQMITSIGKLMNLNFTENVLKEIHKESGGHPFIARQIARLLSQSYSQENEVVMEYSFTAEDWENLLFEYEELNNYFEESIWKNYQKNNLKVEIMILKILAVNETLQKYLPEKLLLTKLNDDFTKSQSRKGINSLYMLELIERKKEFGNNFYKIKIPHFSRWLQMQINEQEIIQCQIIQ